LAPVTPHFILLDIRNLIQSSGLGSVTPNSPIVDSQSVATQQKGAIGGHDAAKHTKGCKRHIVVGVLGLILAGAVTGTNVQDCDGGQLVLKGLKDCFPRLARAWADGAYASRLVEWAEKTARVCARLSLADQRDGLASLSCHGVGSWSEPSHGWATTVAWLGITTSVHASALGSKSL
jgi:hypothetical protein